MIFYPITNELASSPEVQRSEFLKNLCASTIGMYPHGAPILPWVGYLAKKQDTVVGTCAYKSPPLLGEIEIAYFTFPEYEGQQIATRMVQHLIDIAVKNGVVIIKAQTLPEANASNRILEKLGFSFTGSVNHPEDGHVWEWRRVSAA